MIDGLNAMPLKIFPTRPGDAPGIDLQLDIMCHCALGSIHQVLTARGVDVDAALPWTRHWFARYQMADGGLNCDETAYLVADECPTSMVGPSARLGAALAPPPDAERPRSLERAAGFLVARKLTLGSPSRHNAVEREVAKIWLLPCFPRFY